ncbi:MAG: hypothetical protein ABXS93_04440 [Sulfurimonas sp.]
MSLSNKIFMNIIKLVINLNGFKTKKKLYNKVQNRDPKPLKRVDYDFLKETNLSGCINYDKFKEVFYKEFTFFTSLSGGKKHETN